MLARFRTPAPPAATLCLAILIAGSGGPALAGSRVVDDDLVECPAADHTTLADAFAAASPGDTIQVCPGTYPEPDLVVDKLLTVTGQGTADTFIEPSLYGFLVQADGFTLSDLTVRNGSQGVRFELAGGTIDNTRIENVRFEGHSSNAVELHAETTVTNFTVAGSHFVNNANGIRMSSTSTTDNLTVTGSTFDGQTIGIYQANRGNTSSLRGLLVSGCTFVNQTNAGIFAEEIRDALIEGNDFVNNVAGITIFKHYIGAGVGLENVIVRDNVFTDHDSWAVLHWQLNSGMAGDFVIEDNLILQDVGLLTNDFGLIDLRFDPAFSHAPLIIAGNTATLSGSFAGGAGALAAHALKVRGTPTDLRVTSNTFDGGGVGELGGVPPSSGFYLQTDDGTFGATTADAGIEVLCNTITGFVNGLSVYDPLGMAPGGLPAGATVILPGNDLSANTGLGVDNSGTSATVDAENNWWGDASGPSGAGPGSGVAVSANVDFDPFLDTAPAGCANLSAVKIGDPDPVLAGDVLTYTVTVSNSGPNEALAVVATDTLPPEVSFVATSGCAEDPAGVPTCGLGTIPPDGSAQYTITVDVSSGAGGTVINQVEATAAELDLSPGDNVATEETLVIALEALIEVPTLGTAGLVLLALLVALAGQAVLRRR